MTVILNFCSVELISLLWRHGFTAIGIEDASRTEITIEPCNAIELQRLGVLLEIYGIE